MQNDKRGFTLVELIVVIGIFSLIMGVIYGIFVSSRKVQTAEEQLVGLAQEARGGLEQMVRETRMAGVQVANNVGICTGGPNNRILLIKMQPTDMEFEGDVDLDGKLERIRYFYNATSKVLSRWEYEVTNEAGWNAPGTRCSDSIANSPVSPIMKADVAYNINGLAISYYDSGNNITADPLEVTKIALRLTATGEMNVTGGATPPSKTLTVEVMLPNLGTGRSSMDITPPATPINVAAVNRRVCGYLGATWTANTERDLAGYRVFYRMAGVTEWLGTSTLGLVTSFETGGLAQGQSYEVSVAAFDTSGNISNASAPVSVVLNDDLSPVPYVWTAYPGGGTKAAGQQLNSILDAPVASLITDASPWVQLKWSAFGDFDRDNRYMDSQGNIYPVNYQIQRYSPVTSAWTTIEANYNATTPNAQGFITYTDTTVPTKCVTYKYKVRAVETTCGKTSSWSNEPTGNGPRSGQDSPSNGITNTTPNSTAVVSPLSSFDASGGARLVLVDYTPPNDPMYENVAIRYNRNLTGADAYPATSSSGSKVCDPCANDVTGDGRILLQHARTGNFDPKLDSQTDGKIADNGVENGYHYFYASFPIDRCGTYGEAAYARSKAKICADGQYPGATEPPTNFNAIGICDNIYMSWTYSTWNGQQPTGSDFDYEGDPTPWDLVYYELLRCENSGAFTCDPRTDPSVTRIELGLSYVDVQTGGDPLVESKLYRYSVRTVDCAENKSDLSTVLPSAGGISPGKVTGSGSTDEAGKFVGNAKGKNFNSVDLYIKNTSANKLVLRGFKSVSWKGKADARLYKISAGNSTLWQAQSTSGVGTCDGLGVCSTVAPGTPGETNNFPVTMNELAEPRLTFEFRTSAGSTVVNMKGADITLTPEYSNEFTSGYICPPATAVPHSFIVTVASGPTISSITQNKPASGTAVSQTVPPDANHTASGAEGVVITAQMTALAGTSVSTAYLYYAVTEKTATSPSEPTDFLTSYAPYVRVAMTSLGGGVYNATIPAQSTKRVWFYVTATDNKGNTTIAPGDQPLLGFKAYVYDTCASYLYGFEDGAFTGWTVTTSGTFPQVQTGVVYSGGYAAYMGDGATGLYGGGVVLPAIASIQRNVELPFCGNLNPKLRLRYRVAGNDLSDASASCLFGAYWDWMKLFINNTEIALWRADSAGWMAFSHDLSASKGTTIDLKISAFTCDAGVVVNYYIDDVQVVYE